MADHDEWKRDLIALRNALGSIEIEYVEKGKVQMTSFEAARNIMNRCLAYSRAASPHPAPHAMTDAQIIEIAGKCGLAAAENLAFRGSIDEMPLDEREDYDRTITFARALLSQVKEPAESLTYGEGRVKSHGVSTRVERVDIAPVRAAYLRVFGTLDGWQDIHGSYFTEGYIEGMKAQPAAVEPAKPVGFIAPSSLERARRAHGSVTMWLTKMDEFEMPLYAATSPDATAYNAALEAAARICDKTSREQDGFGNHLQAGMCDYLAEEIRALKADAPSSEAAAEQLRMPLIARALAEWHEDDGPVTWWAWCGHDWAGEVPWCGSPLDSDWPGYHTHWTPAPKQPAALAQPDAGEKA